MNWISCKDRMPERNASCLIAYGDISVVIATYNGDHWQICGDRYGTGTGNVSHWMPLPENPGAEEYRRREIERNLAQKQRDFDKARAELERAQRHAEGILGTR